jgi:beta-glucosidase
MWISTYAPPFRYIDYRYLNKQGTKPRYAFGHGLSYTNFSLSATMSKVTSLTTLPPARPSKGPTPTYSNALPAASEAYRPAGFVQIWRYLYSWLDNDAADAAHAIGASNSSTYPYPAGYSDTQQPGPAAGGAQGGNPALFDVAYTLSVNVTNTGTQFAGKQVAQAYVQFPTGFQYDTPIIQLRDFNKTTTLAPGQTEALTLSLTRKDLSVWDVVLQNWVVSDGRYTIWIGDSSDTLAIACYTDTLQCQSNMPSPV